jgi:hypothetical protein
LLYIVDYLINNRADLGLVLQGSVPGDADDDVF